MKKHQLSINHSGYRWHECESLDSTSTECLKAARNGDAGNLWISAERQIEGRGRSGRRWESEPGNLYASLLLVDPVDSVAKVVQLALLSVIAVGDALHEITSGNLRISYKWPNDLLVRGAKISGILLESEQRTDGSIAVVIGTGVNCNTHPDQSIYPTTDLKSLGFNVEPVELLQLLFKSTDKWLHQWNRGGNFELIRETWLSKAEGIGKMITIRLPNQSFEGTFAGLDANGNLELKQANCDNILISAGDVFLPGQ